MASILVAAAAIAARADTVEATALFHLDRGVAAFHRGDYVTAQREFTAAHDLVPERANPYRWLALTAAQLGDCPTARVHADAFLIRVGPDDARAAELVRLRELCHRTGATRVVTHAHVSTAPRRLLISTTSPSTTCIRSASSGLISTRSAGWSTTLPVRRVCVPEL